eukprot:CAMPEP_0168549114 /NCGR_PEP_ID=MMETSP0413-20121227/4928_1 /TAXON_ID=136452 /ORGANISM="Filamoeba nolandi, Strain NC-AS-23-1" /LENGTH=75 /DNA_ID=CAMNT_0008579475 /DNA_START=233 /DNA_END=460 /DNA_ORIENTATION=-
MVPIIEIRGCVSYRRLIYNNLALNSKCLFVLADVRKETVSLHQFGKASGIHEGDDGEQNVVRYALKGAMINRRSV